MNLDGGDRIRSFFFFFWVNDRIQSFKFEVDGYISTSDIDQREFGTQINGPDHHTTAKSTLAISSVEVC